MEIPVIMTPMNGTNREIQSKWYTAEELSELIKLADSGDILEIFSGRGSEWGIYAGCSMSPTGQQVAYIVYFSTKFELPAGELDYVVVTSVRLKSLVDVAGENKIRINNEDDKWKNGASDIGQINERIKRFVGSHLPKDSLNHNSEEFVRYCRYKEIKKYPGIPCFSVILHFLLSYSVSDALKLAGAAYFIDRVIFQLYPSLIPEVRKELKIVTGLLFWVILAGLCSAAYLSGLSYLPLHYGTFMVVTLKCLLFGSVTLYCFAELQLAFTLLVNLTITEFLISTLYYAAYKEDLPVVIFVIGLCWLAYICESTYAHKLKWRFYFALVTQIYVFSAGGVGYTFLYAAMQYHFIQQHIQS